MTAKFAQVNALRMFPKFEETHAGDFITRFVIVVDRIIAILLASNREVLGKMHFRNRMNILDTLTEGIKRSILSEEAE